MVKRKKRHWCKRTFSKQVCCAIGGPQCSIAEVGMVVCKSVQEPDGYWKVSVPESDGVGFQTSVPPHQE